MSKALLLSLSVLFFIVTLTAQTEQNPPSTIAHQSWLTGGAHSPNENLESSPPLPHPEVMRDPTMPCGGDGPLSCCWRHYTSVGQVYTPSRGHTASKAPENFISCSPEGSGVRDSPSLQRPSEAFRSSRRRLGRPSRPRTRRSERAGRWAFA